MGRGDVQMARSSASPGQESRKGEVTACVCGGGGLPMESHRASLLDLDLCRRSRHLRPEGEERHSFLLWSVSEGFNPTRHRNTCRV